MIQFTDVVKTYAQGNNALNGVTMQIEDGEFVFLIGPSGSGKSTIIKLITGELKPTSGAVHVNGYNLERIRKREVPFMRRTVGVVFQDFRLIDNMTVYDNVAFAMRVVGATNREIRERVPYVLELVGLDTKSRRHPTELSGGEQQRLAIARALALNPEILCFDEPTSALDPELTGEVLRVIRGLKTKDNTMIVVTHEMEFARSVADVVIYMADGVIEEMGTPAEIFENPKSDKTRAFISGAQNSF